MMGIPLAPTASLLFAADFNDRPPPFRNTDFIDFRLPFFVDLDLDFLPSFLRDARPALDDRRGEGECEDLEDRDRRFLEREDLRLILPSCSVPSILDRGIYSKT